jgi:hypothetical protein
MFAWFAPAIRLRFRALELLVSRYLQAHKVQWQKAQDLMIGSNIAHRLPVNPRLEQGLGFLGQVEIGDCSLERLGCHADRL